MPVEHRRRSERSGHAGEALAEIRESLAILGPLKQQHPKVEQYRQVSARAHISLGALNASLGNNVDARSAYATAAADYESLVEPSLSDTYNLACADARLVVIDPNNKSTHVNRAMAALHRAGAEGFPDLETLNQDEDLEPLRNRPEFVVMMLDRMMPANPFAP